MTPRNPRTRLAAPLLLLLALPGCGCLLPAQSSFGQCATLSVALAVAAPLVAVAAPVVLTAGAINAVDRAIAPPATRLAAPAPAPCAEPAADGAAGCR